MNITKILEDLHEERAAVEQAIVVLERIASGRGRRRGRPPAWMTGAVAPASDGAKAYVRTPGRPCPYGASTAPTVGKAEAGAMIPPN